MYTNKHEFIYINNNRFQDSIFCLTTESKQVFAAYFNLAQSYILIFSPLFM